MGPSFVLAGILQREYLLPPLGHPLLDVPGGNLLYAASGLRIWAEDVGLLGRVGEDYPQRWLQEFRSRGFDTDGIRVLTGNLDLRSFQAYSDNYEPVRSNIVSQFARRGIPFPKALLGYKPLPDVQEDSSQPYQRAPGVRDIPKDYFRASAVHICPMDLVSQEQLMVTFRAKSSRVLTLDPSASFMTRENIRDLFGLLNSLSAFLPSQEELRTLFWGQTDDIWEMAEALGAYGCPIIVVKCGGQGIMLFDVPGNHRWIIPAYESRLTDPTGAGDAFCGGFLAGYQKNNDPLEAALYGSVSASLKVEGSGAFYPLSVMPGLAQARLDVLRNQVRAV